MVLLATMRLLNIRLGCQIGSTQYNGTIAKHVQMIKICILQVALKL